MLVSQLLINILKYLVFKTDAYQEAKNLNFKRLDNPYNLGTRGEIKLFRDELYA